MYQVPQIWNEYCPDTEESELVLAHRIGAIAEVIMEKKKTAAAAHKAAKKAQEM
jgi:hypothetical protein